MPLPTPILSLRPHPLPALFRAVFTIRAEEDHLVGRLAVVKLPPSVISGKRVVADNGRIVARPIVLAVDPFWTNNDRLNLLLILILNCSHPSACHRT